MFNIHFDLDVIATEHSPYKIDRLSPSMIGSYLSCPLAFYYGYIAKIQMPQNRIHLLFGSAIHKAIEEMYNGHPEPLTVFKENFKREDLDDEGKKMFSEYYGLGLEMTKNYLELHPTLNELYALNEGFSEEKFKQLVINPITGQPSTVPLSGIVDRRTASGIIIDYKTSKTEYAVEDQKFRVQYLLYNLWYYSVHGKLADNTLFIVLLKKYKKTKRDKVIQILSSKPSLEDLAEAWYEVESILSKIENGHFERPSENHPRYCDCYKYEKFLGIG